MIVTNCFFNISFAWYRTKHCRSKTTSFPRRLIIISFVPSNWELPIFIFWIPLQVKEREKELAQQNQWEQQNQELNSSSFVLQQQLDSPNLGYIVVSPFRSPFLYSTFGIRSATGLSKSSIKISLKNEKINFQITCIQSSFNQLHKVLKKKGCICLGFWSNGKCATQCVSALHRFEFYCRQKLDI